MTEAAAYIAKLSEDRRAAISKLRAAVRKNLPKGYAERTMYGMIAYIVPLKLYPAGCHGDPPEPLLYAGLSSHKNHVSLHLTQMYLEPATEQWMRDEFRKTGKKLDMGKSCIRFASAEDLALDVIGEAIARVSVADFIQTYEDFRRLRANRKAS